MTIQIIEADATTDEYELYEKPEMRLHQDEPVDRTMMVELPADPKTRLTLGQHEDEQLRHFVHFDRKKSDKSGVSRIKRSRRRLGHTLHRRLFSDDPGDLSIYEMFILTKREKAQIRLYREEARRSRTLLPQLQPA